MRWLLVVPEDNCSYTSPPSADVACQYPSASVLSQWVNQGRKKSYNDLGRVLEFINPNGVPSSNLVGYGRSLVTAFASNAKVDDLFYESFEVLPEATCKFTNGNCSHPITPGLYTNFNHIDNYSRTGQKSLQVLNTVNKEVCFHLKGGLDRTRRHTASVWYLDERDGSSPTSTTATRPGLRIGQSNVCVDESYPNGKDGLEPPGPESPLYPARATGSLKWKRLETTFQICEHPDYDPEQVQVCIGASTGSIGLPVTYDELRVTPENSQMSTYTYNDKGRMTSMADPNETVTRFEYDLLGNLTGIRDDDGVLLSEKAKKFGNR